MAEISIVCITFNHERFIKAAVSSFFSQDFNGRGEILIFDDFSKDETSNEIKRISKHCPKSFQFKLNENQKNIGTRKNFLQALNSVKFEYVAFCEGDDYWTDPYKLQKQVDFLESNPTYSAVFGSTQILMDEPQAPAWALGHFDAKEDTDLLLVDFLKEKMPAHVSSILFRKDVLSPSFIKNYKDIVPGDRYLAAGCFLKGKVRYLAQPFSAYRRHARGISQTAEHSEVGLHAGNVHMLIRLLKQFPEKNRSDIYYCLNWRLNETAYAYRRISRLKAKFQALKMIYRFYPRALFFKFIFRETLIQLFPRFIRRIHARSKPA
jgi:glycosyltransferase involved in cell wall biosynthesis